MQGTAQNGKRFALQIGDFDRAHSLKKERFVIYSLETWEPIAEITPDEHADEQSWTAFSPDGSLFVVGSPLRANSFSSAVKPQMPSNVSIRACPISSSTGALPSRTTSRVCIPASRAASSSRTTSEKKIASTGATFIAMAMAI